MSWFTPERRLFIYQFTTSLLTVAVGLNILTQGTADEVILNIRQILDGITALSALLSTIIASKHVPKL